MKFIVTKEVGKLARWLRLLGFDTVYFNSDNLGTLIVQALRDNRIIITRNKNIKHLQKSTLVINSNKLYEQLKEVRDKLNFPIEESKMFRRCTICNNLLKEVEKEAIKKLIPQYVYEHQNFFMCCPSCGKIYWQGSHWGNVRRYLKELAPKLKN